MDSITDINPSYADETGHSQGRDDRELRKTLLAGLIGGVVAAGAYFIYTRLEDEQKEALRQTVGKFVEDKIADVRSQLKF
ncbi:MAG TPA: hypothetical protein VGQ96_04465 [Candidatus Eremiobacteraceae bacterium]|nr:hypothetical protein [Candidatus Eremiobacteraceae bacterium]